MTIEGDIRVRLDWDGARVRGVTIRSTRPLASRVLVGRQASEVPDWVARLYSVCSVAQGSAAAAALEAAERQSLIFDASSGCAIALESLQEDLRRLLIDLPQALGDTPQVAPVASLRRALAPWLDARRAALAGNAAQRFAGESLGTIGALASQCVLGEPADVFLSRASERALRDWASEAPTLPARVARSLLERAAQGASAVRTMPPIDDAALERAVVDALRTDPAFAQAPHWHGEPVETGALARAASHPGVAALIGVHGNGLAARLFARLVQVAQTIDALARADFAGIARAWSPAPNEGVSAVQTARGLLLHYARTAGAAVASYAIVAPTDWNFHPQGALAKGLARLEARDAATLERDARLLVQALDPCVACSVEVSHA
jgi:hypothetical protein